MSDLSRTAALLTLFQLLAVTTAFSCSGLGERYCEDAAILTTECPDACSKQNCQMMKKSKKVPQRGVTAYDDSYTFENLVESGLYQHVFVRNNKVCMGHCWREPWKARCARWESHLGSRICVALDCSHDPGSDYNSGNRFVGCHPDENGKPKKTFHKPTCRECEMLFPNSCGNGNANIGSSSDAVDVSATSPVEDDSVAPDDSSASEGDDSSEDVKVIVKDPSSDAPEKPSSESHPLWSISSSDEVTVNAAAVGLVSEPEANEDDEDDEDESFTSLESAPYGWQILFLDEYEETESYVVPMVNIILQFGDLIKDLDEQAAKNVTDVMAAIAGVDVEQAMVLHTYNDPEEDMLTASVGIITSYPELMAAKLRRVGNEAWSEAFANSANMTFLPWSLSAEIKHVSQSMITEHASKHATLVPVQSLKSVPAEVTTSAQPATSAAASGLSCSNTIVAAYVGIGTLATLMFLTY